jgi:hypothetical protein
VLGVILCAAVGHADESDEAIVDACLKAWQEREATFRTFELSWSETVVAPLHLYTGTGAPKQDHTGGAPAPSETVTLEYERSLLIDGEKLRYADKGRLWLANLGRFGQSHHSTAWDGTKETSFSENEGAEYVYGYVHRDNDILNLATVGHVLTAFRPFQQYVVAIPEKPEVLPQFAEINGVRCRVLRCAAASGGHYQVWVDPMRGYLPLRVEAVKGQVTGLQHDIQYAMDPAGRWVPSSSTEILGRADSPNRTSCRYVFTNCKSLDSVEPSRFVLDFPVGSWIRDEVENTKYLVRAGSAKRIILPSENGADYEALLHTETGRAHTYNAKGDGRIYLWLAALAACIVMTVAVVWGLRRRAKSRA